MSEKPSFLSKISRLSTGTVTCGRSLLHKFIPARFSGAALLLLCGLAINAATRLVLCIYSWQQMDSTLCALAGVFLTGLLFDLIAQACLLAPLTVYLALVPQRWFHRAFHRYILFGLCCAVCYIDCFTAVAEFVFWSEFGARFNFIAVDYLAYTTEVLTNIWQSYPIVPMMAAVMTVTVGMVCWQWKRPACRRWLESCVAWRSRLRFAALYLAFTGLALWALDADQRPAFGGNRYLSELSANGLYTLAAAFRHNRLDYEQFYSTMPLDEVDRITREELGRTGDTFLSNDLLDFRRQVTATGPEHRWNVILVLEESLSASFSGTLNGGGKSFTPNLDRLARNSLFLQRCFASGTRTVRSIEAVELSVPPTPGQSIVKRTNQADLFSMGRLFHERGYRTTFIYGGNGFFDNMNAFFAANHYDIQDSTSKLSTPKTFTNAWGSCDEDLFRWAIDAADRAHADGVPFHHFILTTSNHRPYTFPEGTIDAPQYSRSSAVRYSDYSLGKFIEAAEKKPWFDNTIFVIVADHCHSTSGREALPLNKYHIPALFFNPKLIPARRIDTVCSQIDIAPTLFGLLNWSYVSEFYGMDLNRLAPNSGRAFPGTFQHLGYLNGSSGDLTTLYVQRRHDVRRWSLTPPFAELGPDKRTDDVAKSIAIYQSASRRNAGRLDQIFSRESENAQNR